MYKLTNRHYSRVYPRTYDNAGDPTNASPCSPRLFFEEFSSPNLYDTVHPFRDEEAGDAEEEQASRY